MHWNEHPVVAFDTETTGLNAWQGERVIEFAAVRFHVDDGFRVREETLERHQFLFNPGIPIPRAVRDLTGISDEDLEHEPPFPERARRIRELLADAITVAHNYPFDQAFLDMEFRRAGIYWPYPLAEIDTVDLSRRFFPEAHRHKLEDLVRRVDVRLEGAHRALNDAEATARAFVNITRRFEAPSDLDGLVDWADAVGRPPDTGHLLRGERGVLFGEGPHRGELVSHHPDYLSWMLVAQERGREGWQHRFPGSVRYWAARWLRVRAAGRAPLGIKSFGPEDWGLDSCALPDAHLEPAEPPR